MCLVLHCRTHARSCRLYVSGATAGEGAEDITNSESIAQIRAGVVHREASQTRPRVAFNRVETVPLNHIILEVKQLNGDTRICFEDKIGHAK